MESHSDQLHFLEDPQSGVLTSDLMQAIKDVSIVQGSDGISPPPATNLLPQLVTPGDHNVVQNENPLPHHSTGTSFHCMCQLVEGLFTLALKTPVKVYNIVSGDGDIDG